LVAASEALAAMQAALEGMVAAAPGADAGGGARSGGPPAGAGAARPRRDRGPVRRPTPLPPGVFEESREAAEHLVRVPSALLVVDGYNASLRRWGELAISEQRSRLTDALEALAARTGVGVEVVFDGDDSETVGGGGRGGGLRRGTGPPRRRVRVSFSPGSVEADEVIVDLVERLPVTQPVIVATDDRRVRREASARGANLVTSVQLFQLLGLDLDR
jgi:predicted RNA-binding protein with PIN domain